MVLEVFGVGRVRALQMRRAGRGGVCFLSCFSWGCWAGLFTLRISRLRLRDVCLDSGREGFGVGDGVVAGREVVMIRRLRIRGRTLGRDMGMVRTRGGDLGFGVEHLGELLRDTWLGTEETDKSLHLPREAIPGLEVILGAQAPLLGEALRAPAHLQGTRAQVLDQRHGDSVVVHGIF